MSDPAKKLVPLVRPSLGDAEVDAVARTIRSGWITQGPEVAAFEKEFALATGAEHAVAVSNCTVALELALRALGVGAGDDVVTVSHSFIATANAIWALGARPVFVDVEEDTLGMDPRALERALTPRTKVVLAVHQIGIPCDLQGILTVAKKHNLPTVEDAACAIGSEVLWDGRWERIGKPHGAVACFSFHPRKVVTTGDGGMLSTRDPELAKRFRLLRQHGMSVPDTIRHHSPQVVFEDYVEPGFNYRLTDLQAAVGRPQLARLAEITAERRRLGERYQRAFEKNPLLAPPRERPWARSNWQSYPVFLRAGFEGEQRRTMQLLLDRAISTRRGVMNAHQEPAYAGTDRATWGALPVSEKLRDTAILLPFFHGMRDDEQARVIEECDAVAREIAGA